MAAETKVPNQEITETPDLSCPFCRRIASGGFDRDGEAAVAFADLYPLNPGHMLIVPRRHVCDIYALTPPERARLWQLVDDVALAMRRQSGIDGLNIGVNMGEAAGQTIGHAHIHVVPRHTGDVDDPRGGIRWMIPERAAYWSAT